MTSVVIEARFAGPPRSGQGGYVAGVLARELANPAEVTLRRPPPLDRELTIVPAPAGGARLCDGDEVIAEGKAVDAIDVGDVPIVRWDGALASGKRALAEYAPTHPFPGCFGCGPDNRNGLRLLAGPVDGMAGVFAAPWVPADALADADGTIPSEVVWAALDCPTFAPMLADGDVAVLGRIAVEIRGPITLGYRYVITAWRTGRDGRKHHTAGALSSDMGGALAVVRATWIEVDAAQFVAST